MIGEEPIFKDIALTITTIMFFFFKRGIKRILLRGDGCIFRDLGHVPRDAMHLIEGNSHGKFNNTTKSQRMSSEHIIFHKNVYKCKNNVKGGVGR